MAEAVVEGPPLSRFFCHKCSLEITPVMPEFVCPNCSLGFVEQLEEPAEHDDSDMDLEDDMQPESILSERLEHWNNFFQLHAGPERRVIRTRDRDGANSRRPGRFNREPAPLDLFQDIIINLATGMGVGALSGVRGGNAPVLFLGNPGDYAWGREGLDAIVTQLLNQMDGTGPPPLAKEKIDKIPTVVITEDQVRKSLQCSVCWEDFNINESVRQLPCEHVYHENCIIPWLELHHGTCPICRKSLSDDSSDDQHSGSGLQSMGLAALIRAAEDSTSSRNSSTSSSGSTSSSRTSHQPSDFNMDQEYD